MYRSRSQEWNISIMVPSTLPKFVQLRSAQHRLKKMNSIGMKPMAVVKPISSIQSQAIYTGTDESNSSRRLQKYQWTEQSIRDMNKLSKICETEDEVPNVVWNAKTVDFMQEDSLKTKVKRLEYELHQIDNQFRLQSSTLCSTGNELMRMATLIESLEKDKKLLQDLFKKSKDAHFEAELQLSTLIKSNSRHENLITTLEKDLENEKLTKSQFERENKRLDNDLKLSLETITAVENTVKEFQKKLASKEDELNTSAAQLEEKHKLTANLQQDIKLLQEKLVVTEQQLSKERQTRLNLEQIELSQRTELENLSIKFEKFVTDYAVQLERSNQKENELNRVKKDMAKIIDERNGTIQTLKDKFSEQVLSLNENITSLQADKQKLEKCITESSRKNDEISAEWESALKEKQNMEVKKNKADVKAFEHELKIEQQNGEMSLLTGQKARLATEVQNLASELTLANFSIKQLLADKSRLVREASLLASNLDDSNKELSVQKSRAIEIAGENSSLKHKIDEIEQMNGDFVRKLLVSTETISKLTNKLQEAELFRIQDLENQKKYYDLKIAQQLQELDILNSRINSLENIKSHMVKEIKDLNDSLETVNNRVHHLDKKVKAYEKSMAELEENYNETRQQLKISQSETKALTEITIKLETYLQDSQDEIVKLHQENEQIRGELRNLNVELMQLSEKARESESQRRRLLEENEHINKTLLESENALLEKSNHVNRLKAEVDNFNIILEGKIREKVDEFEIIRKSLNVTIEELRTCLEIETATKIEAIKQQKLLQDKVVDLETSLQQADAYRTEAQENIRKLQEGNRMLALNVLKKVEDCKSVEQQLIMEENQVAILLKEGEELETDLRNTKAKSNDLQLKLTLTETELMTKSCYADFLETQNKKMEKECLDLQAEYNLQQNVIINVENRLKDSEADRVSLTQQLLNESDNLMVSQQKNRECESVILESRTRIEELEKSMATAVEKAVSAEKEKVLLAQKKLQEEQQLHSSAKKLQQHTLKQLQETQFILNEEQKRSSRMNEMVDTLENKIHIYKTQREEAEAVSNANFLRSRNLTTELNHTSDRAELAEQVLTKVRKSNRTRAINLGISHMDSDLYLY